MDIKDIVEQAYKNGYIEGIKKFAKRLKEKTKLHEIYSIPTCTVKWDIDELVEEMKNERV